MRNNADTTAVRVKRAMENASAHGGKPGLACPIEGKVPFGGQHLGRLSIENQYLYKEMAEAGKAAEAAAEAALRAITHLENMSKVVSEAVQAEFGGTGLPRIAIGPGWMVFGYTAEQLKDHSAARTNHLLRSISELMERAGVPSPDFDDLFEDIGRHRHASAH